MTTITKTFYRAFDGTEFDTADACQEYEKKRAIPSGVIVYDQDFIRTTDPNKAIFIVVTRTLSKNENYQLLNWINSADATDEIEDEFFEHGVHVWDYVEENYTHISRDNIYTYRRLFDLAEKECS